MVPIGKSADKYLKEYLAEIRPRYAKKNKQERRLFLTDQGKPVSGNSIRTSLFHYKKEDALKEISADFECPWVQRNCNMDIEQTITEYVRHLEGLGYAATTMASARDNLNFFVKYLREKGITDLRQVTGGIMADYKRQVMAEALAVTTKQKRLRIVARLFTWLGNKNALLINPAEGLADNIRTGRRIMPILTALEVRKLMAQPDLCTKIGLRNRAIMELFYSSGLRRAELCGLNVHDLDFDGRVVMVRRGKGGKDRMVPVGKTACYYLKQYLDKVRPTFAGKNRVNESLFLTHRGATLAGGTVKDFLRIYQRRAGITKQRGSHILRRSCAAHMLRGGADLRSIQELLGHEHLHTTQLYTFIASVDLKEAHRKYHPGKNL